MTPQTIADLDATLRAALAAELVGVDVYGFREEPVVVRPTVLAYAEDIDRGPLLRGSGLVTVTLTAWLLVPMEDPDTADDTLAVLLNDVLDALEEQDYVGGWTRARRGLYQNRWHGW